MTLRLELHQTAPRLGDLAGNLARTREAVEAAAPGGLLVFPELSLTGYDLGARARDLALPEDAPPPLTVSDPASTAVVGFPELAADGRLYNAVGAVGAAGWVHRHRKRYLPTYGMFDEARFFAAADTGPRIFHPHPEWPTALLVCEELWHPALGYLAAVRGARLVLVIAAAPGRGTPGDPEEDGPRFASHRSWRLLARTLALTHGIYVGLANRVGVEGGAVFAGGSLVVGPDGTVLAEASHEAEDRIEVELSAEALHTARTPYSHIRDEDPHLVLRELETILKRKSDPGM